MELSDDMEKFKTFYYLLFSPNPLRDNVKVWIDDGSVTMILKRDKFYSMIRSLLGPEVELKVHTACTVYGGFFLLDRTKGTIVQKQVLSQNEKLNPSKIFSDIQKGRQGKDDFYGRAAEYQKFIQQKSDENGKTISSDGNGITKYSGFINYSEEKR